MKTLPSSKAWATTEKNIPINSLSMIYTFRYGHLYRRKSVLHRKSQ